MSPVTSIVQPAVVYSPALQSDPQALIKQIEDIRKSRVITYFLVDRPPMLNILMGEDAVRPMYEHLLSIGKTKRIDLFLYSRGGDVSVPWRIVSMIREFADEFCVLIPYKAYSAATMIALGADQIVMGPKAELGPIDASLNRSPIEGSSSPAQINVEDVISYISFMKEKVGLTDQNALAAVVSQLAQHLMPLSLGSVNRTHSHIRLVARKLLASHSQRVDDSIAAKVIETLAEKMYSHGHAVARREARDLDLPILENAGSVEQVMWDLYRYYENCFDLNDILDPESILTSKDAEEHTEPDLKVGVIESLGKKHTYTTNVVVKRKRNVPTNPQINFNLQLPPLPDGMTIQTIPAQLQQFIIQVQSTLNVEVPKIVKAEITRQSPLTGFEMRIYGTKWVEDASSSSTR